MDPLLMLARALHVGLGVFWVGALVFNAAFLLPSMREAGPDAAKVAAGLMKRRFMQILPATAGVTLLSGLYLYWRLSGGFSAGYMTSPAGATYALGGAIAIVAFVIGVSMVRPAMLRAMKLSEAGMSAAPPERAAALAEAQSLRAKAETAGQWAAWLLVATTIAMAVARYL
jgi:uncharacterized membrane protein